MKNILLLVAALVVVGYLVMVPERTVAPEASLSIPETHQDWADQTGIEFDQYLQDVNAGYSVHEVKDGSIVIFETMRGAYQSAFQAYFVPVAQTGETLEFAILKFYNPITEEYDEGLIALSYLPESREFTFHAKGRGLGDCGSSGTYTWNNETKETELAEYFHMSVCDGEYDEWPQIYP